MCISIGSLLPFVSLTTLGIDITNWKTLAYNREAQAAGCCVLPGEVGRRGRECVP